MPIRRVLILGCKGTLGGQLMKLFPEATGWDREDIDVLDFPALRARVAALESVPDAIVNCVAFNDVDAAEERPRQALALNAEFPGALAHFTGQLGIPLVHYSSNYVFDGVAGEYVETDPPAPLSAYGHSKWAGEQRIAACGGPCYIVRTAVLFGPKGASDLSKKSFVDLMRDLSATRDTIQAVADEVNSVTYAPDLAAATRGLLDLLPQPGIYHITNSGGASWFDLACEIFRLTGKNVRVVPVPSSHFTRLARRPAKAILHNTKLPPVRTWEAALKEFLHQGGAPAPRRTA
jgi:dTDP-4-dehydrorhamnose reductase